MLTCIFSLGSTLGSAQAAAGADYDPTVGLPFEMAATTRPLGMVTVSITDMPDPVPDGGIVNYVVRVSAATTQAGFILGGTFTSTGFASGNIDPAPQNPVGLVDGVPDGTWSCSISTPPNAVFCEPRSSDGTGVLLPGKTYEFTIAARVSSTMLPDSIQLTMLGTTATTNIQAPPPANLSIAALANPARPSPGASFDVVTTVSNDLTGGPSAPFSVTVTSGEVTLGNATNPSIWSCSVVGNGRICAYTGSPLGPGASVDLVLPSTAPLGGTLVQVQAGIAVTTPDIVVGPNSLTVLAPTAASLPVMVSAPPDPSLVGQQMMYSLTLTNVDGASPNDGSTGQNAGITISGFDSAGSATSSFVSGTGGNWNCVPVTPSGPDFMVNCDYGLPLPLNQTTAPLNVVVNAPTVASSYTLTANPTAANLFFNSGDDATVVTGVAAMGDLHITKTASSANVVPGDNVSFVLDVFNDGPSPVSNFTVDDNLPAELTYLGFSGPEFSCVESTGVVNCLFTGSGLAVGASTSVTLDTQAVTEGTAVNSATVNEDTGAPDPDLSNNNDTATVVVSATPLVADLELQVSATPVIQPEANFSFGLSVTNRGPGPADAVRLSAQLSGAAQLNSVTGAGWSCAQLAGSVVCDLAEGVLAADSSASINLNYRALPDASTLSLSSLASARTTDPDTDNNRDVTEVRVQGSDGVDLNLVKTSLPATVALGADYQYQFQVSNQGSASASGVQLIDNLPSGVEFIGAASGDWACNSSGGELSCSLAGSIGPAEMSLLTIDVRAPSLIGTVTNNASVSSEQVDTNLDDNSDSVQTVVAETGGDSADLAVVKMADRDEVQSGGALNYSIQVTNLGPDQATGISVLDNLPAGYSFAGVIATGLDCSLQGTAVVCATSTPLAMGESLELEIRGAVSATSGSLVNQVFVDADTPDPNGSNNTSQTTTRIGVSEGPVNLVVTGDDSADPVMVGDTFDYLITVENVGTGRAFEVTLLDTLPAGVEVVAVAGGVFSCDSSVEQVACEFDGPLMPNDPKEVRISVRAPDEVTTLVNTARADFRGDDLDPSDNMVTIETEVEEVAGNLEDDLERALGDMNDPVINANINPIANLCADPNNPVPDLCQEIVEALDDGRTDEVANTILQIVGQQTVTQHTSLVEASFAQFNNIDARFRQNRGGGGGGFSVAGLNVRYGDQSLPLSLLASAADDEAAIDSDGLIKPWGFFVNGTISGGDKDPTSREVAFDFDSFGLTAGVDYRFSTRAVLGAALGYADFDSDYADGGTLQTDGLSYHLYASWYPTDRFFLDGRLSFSDFDFDQARIINFTIGDLAFDDIAIGQTEGDQVTGALAFGYHLNQGAWSITPSASLSYLDGTIDGFVENGSRLSLQYAEQDVESTVLSASVSVSRVWSTSRGVLVPQLDLAYYYESQNDEHDFNSRILGASAGSAFFIGADQPDTDYGSAGLGVVWVGANGRQAYLSYRNILGISGFSRWTVNAGFRFEY